ncbi:MULTISPECIES: hypothetical protein [unclassified Microcoleus]|uniref:hypothetical protein n=1 Tax=unclassified Microcoleus TaxID=2642155 RepID=UPI0025CD5238|nr:MULTISPECIES: hypothetical protein [unclassified Microcoleus]
MTNDGSPKSSVPNNDDIQKDLDGIGKALIVSVAWSYAEALERTKREQKEQKAKRESQSESQPESQPES